jgi:hypothetical protein
MMNREHQIETAKRRGPATWTYSLSLALLALGASATACGGGDDDGTKLTGGISGSGSSGSGSGAGGTDATGGTGTGGVSATGGSGTGGSGTGGSGTGGSGTGGSSQAGSGGSAMGGTGAGAQGGSGGRAGKGTGGSVGVGGSQSGSGGSGTGGTGGTGMAGKGSGGTSGQGGTGGGAGTSGGGNVAVPAGLPKHFMVGWGAGSYDDTWAKNSGTKYDVQWSYLSGQHGQNWYNTWGGGASDGSFLDGMLSTIDGLGMIPGIHLYNMGYGHDGGDSGLLTEVQDATWTKNYFTEFKVMLQKIKSFGKPVIIVLEGDSFGMLSLLTKNDPSTKAAVASSGLPELAALPNTVAGFGQAFLALRKSVGVPNVAMGPDTPYYAANGDIMNFGPQDTDPLQPHVDYQWSFFGALGVGENATGDRFDFSASCPRDADQDYEMDGRDKWDPSDTASVNKPSINRYAEWLRLYHVTSGRPWVLHQVPIGNSQMTDTAWDKNKSRSGYKDILVEYLFQYEDPASADTRTAHVGQFVDAGVIAMLFGFSNDGVQPTNDLWKDNQPFFNTHVKAFLDAGGYPFK